ncbi:MAG TPA: mechanosensitive ion channel family protein [Vicinamibacteria bacterium]|nr:mechanosensitive ion channel family protein [Vicinamibacteria bacterium]
MQRPRPRALLPPAHALGLVALLAAPATLAGAPLPPRGAARATSSPAPSATPEPVAEAADSPRASVRAFLDLTHRGDYTMAARHLVLTAGDERLGPELARRLRAVLDRHLDLDLDTVSPASEGDLQDGLPNVDVIGHVPDGRGGQDNVTVVRTHDSAMWRFSSQTVSRIDGWYDELPDRWARDWIPRPLQRYGPGWLMWWQWLALPLLAVLALAAGRLLGLLSGRLLHRLAQRTPTPWDDRLLDRARPALTLLWAAAVAALLLPRLALLPEASGLARSLLGAAATFAVFWALWRSVDVWMQFLGERRWAAESASARSLLSVTGNLVKVVVVVGGVVATLAAFGYPVVTVLAGLGIGGIALAFGAQKTIENLFGSISIAADQPFRVGDYVRVENLFGGTVERIGMRSTQIRTDDRTLVSLPNGRLADMRVEDFAPRDRIRFAQTVSLVYGTSEAQARDVVRETERFLRSLPKVWPDAVVAKLLAFAASSIEVEVLCWFRTTDYDEFRNLRQEALLGILRVVEKAGTRLAFPTQTVQLAGGGPAQRAE